MIVDTDILVWHLRGNRTASLFIEDISATERRISAISYMEVVRGCKDRTDLGRVEKLIGDCFLEVVPVTEGITDRAMALLRQFVLSRRPGVNDVLIGATAVETGDTLATANRKHFDFIPGLSLRVFRS